MKILIVTNNTRTINNFRVNLIKCLVKKHEVYVISRFNEKISDEISNKIKFVQLDIEEDNYNIFKELYLIVALFKKIRKINPDLGIFYTIKPNFYCSIICKFLNIKSISNIFGLGFIYLSENKIKKYIFKKILKIITKNSNKIFVQNIYDKKILGEFTENNKLILLNGSGLDTNFYKNKIDSNVIYDFTYIGRIIKDKGVDEFIDAAININKLYPNLKFCIQGKNYTKRRDRVINFQKLDYAIKNNIIKFQDYGDVINTINHSKWILQPSYREGSSRILQESIAMGKPCLASDVPGCNNIIFNNFNGLLFKSKNSESIEDAIIKAINLPSEKYKKFSENSLQYAKKFDSKNINSFYHDEIKRYNIKNKKLLFIQLNEFTYDFFSELNKKFQLKNFKKFFNNSNIIKTIANVEHNFNEPWIQWYSICTGLSSKKHNVFSLGESVKFKHNQIWEKLEEKDLKIASIGSMNAVNRLKSSKNIFLPDPWTNTQLQASNYDKIFYILLKKIILDRNHGIKYYLKTFLFLMVSLKYVPIKDYLEFISLIKSALTNHWGRVFILDYLLTQFYLSKIVKRNFNFTTLFLNGLAHNQHHNLKFLKSDNPKDNVIYQTYKFYDLLLGKIIKFIEPYNIKIFFASGLSQKIVSNNILYYSLNTNFEELFSKINIKFNKLDFLMSRETRIFFNNINEKTSAIEKFLNITNFKSENIFKVDDENELSIKLTIIYEKIIEKNFKLFLNKKIILKNFDKYVVFWAQKHGEHDINGTFCVFPQQQDDKYLVSDLEVHELFKYQSSFFN